MKIFYLNLICILFTTCCGMKQPEQKEYINLGNDTQNNDTQNELLQYEQQYQFIKNKYKELNHKQIVINTQPLTNPIKIFENPHLLNTINNFNVRTWCNNNKYIPITFIPNLETSNYYPISALKQNQFDDFNIQKHAKSITSNITLSICLKDTYNKLIQRNKLINSYDPKNFTMYIKKHNESSQLYFDSLTNGSVTPIIYIPYQAIQDNRFTKKICNIQKSDKINIVITIDNNQINLDLLKNFLTSHTYILFIYAKEKNKTLVDFVNNSPNNIYENTIIINIEQINTLPQYIKDKWSKKTILANKIFGIQENFMHFRKVQKQDIYEYI